MFIFGVNARQARLVPVQLPFLVVSL